MGLIYASGFLVFVAFDLFFAEYFMESSVETTVFMQEKGGAVAKYYSIFASTIATYWIVGFFFLHLLFTHR